MQISVVIPAKDESKSLPGLLDQLLKVDCVDEIIIVDDGSSDETGDVARQKGAKVVTHQFSKGNGAAIKSGARIAKNEYILFMDADGQHSPGDIQKLAARMQPGVDMVVGSRSRSGQASLGRYLANGFYNKFASWVTEQKIDDLTSGFRIVHKEKFLSFIHLLPNKFSYPTTITMSFIRAGYTVVFEPVVVAKREGKSHINLFRDGVRFLLIIFKIATLYSPLKVFLPIAVLHFVLGLGRYLYTYIEYGVFTNMSAILFVSAVQIFLVGLVSEQITTLAFSKK